MIKSAGTETRTIQTSQLSEPSSATMALTKA